MSDTPEISAQRTSQIITSTVYYAGSEVLYADHKKSFFGPFEIEQSPVDLKEDRIQGLIDRDQQIINDITIKTPKETRLYSRCAAAGVLATALICHFAKIGNPEHVAVVFGPGSAVVLGFGEATSRISTRYKRSQVASATARIATYQSLLPAEATEMSD